MVKAMRNAHTDASAEDVDVSEVEVNPLGISIESRGDRSETHWYQWHESAFGEQIISRKRIWPKRSSSYMMLWSTSFVTSCLLNAQNQSKLPGGGGVDDGLTCR